MKSTRKIYKLRATLKIALVFTFLIALFTPNLISAFECELLDIGIDYINEEHRGVSYLNEQQRGSYLVRVSEDGKLLGYGRKPIDTHGAARILNENINIIDQSILVLGPDNNFYYSRNQAVGSFHHSSFWGRVKLPFAGMTKSREGQLTYIDNNSGHFQTKAENVLYALMRLKELGVDISDVQVNIYYSEPLGPALLKLFLSIGIKEKNLYVTKDKPELDVRDPEGL